MRNEKRILKDIFKGGYMPSRGEEPYDRWFFVGSFDHAAFNLTNAQLEKVEPMATRINGVRSMEANLCEGFIAEPRTTGQGWQQTEQNFLDYIKQTGLMVEECKEDAEYNPAYQWKIAYYREIVNFEMKDILFLRQEKENRWSAKVGNRVEYFCIPPQHINFSNLFGEKREYSKFKTYIITNPYAKKRYEKKQYAKKFRRAQEGKVK